MDNLNKKQKIAIIIISIAILVICYYIYSKDKNEELIETQNLEIQNIQNEEEIKSENIFVHISGSVNSQGLIELEAGSRISDAIDKAGGLKEDANISDINLAYKLEDGIKIHIPSNEEKEKIYSENNTQNNVEKTQEYITQTQGNSDESSKKININTATQTQLETLPGIGPSTALNIINYRKEKGKFTSIEEIKQVSGIGESKFNKIKDLINYKW